VIPDPLQVIFAIIGLAFTIAFVGLMVFGFVCGILNEWRSSRERKKRHAQMNLYHLDQRRDRR
jgi:hypothetical protein